MNIEARLAALEQQQALIQARQDILQTIARYARGIDEQLDAELAAIFTDDVVLQTKPWTQRPLHGKALALKAFRNYRWAFQQPRRFITNHQITVHDAGTATGYANWIVMQARDAQSYCGWGSYDWTFRQEDGLWKISSMLITLDCMTTLERGWGMLAERILPFPPRE
ncbi:MAG: nuclear transport factor 2 family protein [Candidatus Tectomicrobia bacterium]|uniref:Nuclear transport factor 2 family protein n=1 Tax=Tectimicrobiota bacterium TaxID=2528274 RepID=A0A937VZ44_UNCTE|nr:nuclear transport factor 2 family protein [Candidatus Tectomicrobia bacterium]